MTALEQKEEIVNRIHTIVNFAINDANTYLYAKCSPTFEQDNKKVPIGGGDFAILLITLVTIEFLGTIDAILNGKSTDFYTKDEIKKLEFVKTEFKNKYKEDELLKDYTEKIFNNFPKEGKLKNGSCRTMRTFLKSTSNIIGIKNKKNEVEKFVKIRNNLAHLFNPNDDVGCIPPVPGKDFVDLILNYKNRNIYFPAKENKSGIDSNALNQKLHPLLEYVLEKVEKTSDDKINKIYKFIYE